MTHRIILSSILILFSLVYSNAQLTGNWPLNGNASDISGNNINGTLMNSPTFSTDSKEGTNSLSLNGINQYVSLGTSSLLPSGTSPRSMSVWAKTNSVATGFGWVASFGQVGSGKAMFIGRNGANLVVGGYSNDITVNNVWAVGVWHHICQTYDGTTAKVYVDGALVSSVAKSWNLVSGSTYIGRQVNGSEYWNGLIDDVRIYSKVLSPVEVQALATPTPAAPTGFVATATSSTTINLAWTDNSTNETGFQIERYQAPGTVYSVVATTAPNITSYIDTGLSIGATYHYRLKAINGSGGSSYTPEITFAVPSIPPAGQGVVWDDIEFNALKDLYTSTNGTNWTNKLDWPVTWPASATSAQFGTWHGVTVTNGDVTSLSLSANNLVGTIPASISKLKALIYFFLQNNPGLTGPIPANLDQFGALEQLYLSSCNLNGIIPPSIFNIPSLVYLSLESNQLTGSIPTNIGNATSLYYLSLAGNDLTGSIPEFEPGKLTNLQVIGLFNNNLTGSIPASIINLKKLNYLALYYNQLSGSIPPVIDSLKDLTVLALSENQLTGPIPDLNNLTKLKQLQLGYNQLSGPIPPAIGNLTSLNGLQLQVNQFDGVIPWSIGKLVNLTDLELDRNQFVGKIPSSIGNLTNATFLSLTGNQLSGSIPDSIGNLTNVQYLYLFDNKLTGSIPSSIGNLVNLAYLRFENNQLTGNFPDLSRLSLLNQLTANYNQLSGTIPSSFLPPGITDFQIHQNHFSGAFPDITGCSNIAALIISNNQFTGNFPSLTGLNRLAVISAENNQFTTMSSDILSLPLLYFVGLTGNSFRSLPDFANQVNKAKLELWIDGNFLDFSQLELLADFGIHSVILTSQKNIHDLDAKNFTIGSALTIPSRPLTPTTTIVWEKQGTDNTWLDITANSEDATHATYARSNTTLADEGVYRWRMTDTALPGQTISSDPIVAKEMVHNVLDDLAYQYRYDTRHRMTAKKIPGADWVYMVYDDRDRLVMSQDGEQRKLNKWSYTEYDVLNRPIITGIYTHSSPVTQAGMSTLINQTPFFETYNGDASNHGYTHSVFSPTVFSGTFDALTIIYYDNYNFRDLWGNGYNYVSDGLSKTIDAITYTQPTTGSENKFLNGQVTGTKVKVLNSDTWLKNITYYDDKYRVIQTIGDNNLGGTDVNSGLVDFVGKVLMTKTTHHAAGKLDEIVARNLDYDHAGRLMKTWHSVNGAGPVLLAQHEYNEVGQLVTKKLYNTDAPSTSDDQRIFKQNIDYRYNIRGWLTSMNDVNTPEASDLFSMNLNYNTPTANGGTPQYNGNISEILWRGADNKANSYGYNYDPMNRLMEANYYNASDATQNGRYNEKIWDIANDQSGYDLNGNIKFLSRTGKTGVNNLGVTTFGQMDNLSYTYTGNQLLKVTDAANTTNGFKDGANTDNDYTYDANGNMDLDNNKNITAITYNHLNLPDKIMKNTGDYIKYSYDATGRKLSQEVFDASNNLKKKSDYAGEFFYENDTLKFINHEEGRIVMTGTTPEYQYHLKDHLGNVRVTFTTKHETQDDIATLEVGKQVKESGEFLRYDQIRMVGSPLFDHTNDATNATGEAIRLSGSANEKTGLVKTLSVMPGDVVNMEVYGKYIDTNSTNWTSALNTLLTGIANGTAPSGTVIDGASYTTNSANPFALTGLNNTASSTGSGPKAYLNYLVFDKDYNLSNAGYVRMSNTPKEDGQNVAHELLSGTITITEAGYVYIYLSNENETPVEVYFDDFKVTQVKSPVVQSEDYYPFGLTFNSSTRESTVPNRWKFQGQEHIDDLGLNWDSYRYRNHQPDIGRFFNIDPMASAFYYNSPYAFSENKVTTHREMEGLEAFFIHGSEADNSMWKKDVADFIMRELKPYFSTDQTADTGFNWTDYAGGGMNQNWIYNTEKNRAMAARQLVSYILKNRKQGQGITLVGHSHGGNVAIQAARILFEKHNIQVNIVNFNTPAFNGASDPENPWDNFGIDQMLHFFTDGDYVAGPASGSSKYGGLVGSNVNQIQLSNPLKTNFIGTAQHRFENVNWQEVLNQFRSNQNNAGGQSSGSKKTAPIYHPHKFKGKE